MAEQFPELSERLTDFIQKQHIFFVGTAQATGRVNVSPKGMDSLRVISPTRIIWQNLTGSGNESAAHILDNPRMTLMWCSFDRQPLILRAYGNARAVHPRDAEWGELASLFPADVGARQCFIIDIELIQTSCGYAVPYFDYNDDRKTLANWSEKKGPDGIAEYWSEKNRFTVDGFATAILDEEKP